VPIDPIGGNPPTREGDRPPQECKRGRTVGSAQKRWPGKNVNDFGKWPGEKRKGEGPISKKTAGSSAGQKADGRGEKHHLPACARNCLLLKIVQEKKDSIAKGSEPAPKKKVGRGKRLVNQQGRRKRGDRREKSIPPHGDP